MPDVLESLDDVIRARRRSTNGESSYVASLCEKGLDAVLKKVAEESGETLIAAKEAQHGGELAAVVRETADLWFHSMVMLSVLGLRSGDVIAELEKRFGLSGIAEKAARHAGSDSTRDA
jgi:phosphoribosyl-ATP pyrophosphohydrolase